MTEQERRPGRPRKPGGAKSGAQRSREFRARQAFKRRLRSLMPIASDPLSLAVRELAYRAKAGGVEADELRRMANTISELHFARHGDVEFFLAECEAEGQKRTRLIQALRKEKEDLKARLERERLHAQRLSQSLRALERKLAARNEK